MERDKIIKALECWASGNACEGSRCELFELTFECTTLQCEHCREKQKYQNVAKVNISKLIAEAKADTVRKMQERLKESPIKVGLPLFGLQTKDEVEDYANGLILQMRDAIDQIAKEMLEGKDGADN